MKSMIFAANWKLHKTPTESRQYLEDFFSLVKESDRKSFVFFPPAANWFVFADSNTRPAVLSWGAQNIFFEKTGAFTGENSADVLKAMGGTHCLIGHSERRRFFNEPSEWLIKKTQIAQSLGLMPLLCVGETIEERRAGQMEAILKEQLLSVVDQIPVGSPLWVAYEPVWAIGTGQVATPEQANEAHEFIRSLLDEKWGNSLARKIPLLYGGSVKSENAASLAAQSEIDGFLVGGASLKAQDFAAIFRESSKHF